MNNAIGNNVKVIREYYGLTQFQLAEKTDLKQALISRTENCARDLTVEEAERITKYFGLAIDDLARTKEDLLLLLKNKSKIADLIEEIGDKKTITTEIADKLKNIDPIHDRNITEVPKLQNILSQLLQVGPKKHIPQSLREAIKKVRDLKSQNRLKI